MECSTKTKSLPLKYRATLYRSNTKRVPICRAAPVLRSTSCSSLPINAKTRSLRKIGLVFPYQSMHDVSQIPSEAGVEEMLPNCASPPLELTERKATFAVPFPHQKFPSLRSTIGSPSTPPALDGLKKKPWLLHSPCAPSIEMELAMLGCWPSFRVFIVKRPRLPS